MFSTSITGSLLRRSHDLIHLVPSSRTRFMVETLSNLKNNKARKDSGGGGGGDAVERMKKFLSGLSKKRQGTPSFPLSHSLLSRLDLML